MLKISLPTKTVRLLQARADKFGLSLTTYVKHVLIKEVENEVYPVHQMSNQAVFDLQKAKKEEKENELIRVNDVDSFLKSI